MKFEEIGPVVSEGKSFKVVDVRMDDGRTNTDGKWSH